MRPGTAAQESSVLSTAAFVRHLSNISRSQHRRCSPSRQVPRSRIGGAKQIACRRRRMLTLLAAQTTARGRSYALSPTKVLQALLREQSRKLVRLFLECASRPPIVTVRLVVRSQRSLGLRSTQRARLALALSSSSGRPRELSNNHQLSPSPPPLPLFSFFLLLWLLLSVPDALRARCCQARGLTLSHPFTRSSLPAPAPAASSLPAPGPCHPAPSCRHSRRLSDRRSRCSLSSSE